MKRSTIWAVTVFFALCAPFTAVAKDIGSCRAAYLARDRVPSVGARAQRAAIFLAALAGTKVLAPTFTKYSADPLAYLNSLIGGLSTYQRLTLTGVQLGGILSAALILDKIERRAIYTRTTIARAIEESEGPRYGPATLALVDFLETLHRARTDNEDRFTALRLPHAPFRSLALAYASAAPTPLQVQSAINWLNQNQLLCEDGAPISNLEFATRFSEALIRFAGLQTVD